MRLDLYQAESEPIANEQMALLAEAKQRTLTGSPLSRLEESGVLHALQVLIENAIGKSKHLLIIGNFCVNQLLKRPSITQRIDRTWAQSPSQI